MNKELATPDAPRWAPQPGIYLPGPDVVVLDTRNYREPAPGMAATISALCVSQHDTTILRVSPNDVVPFVIWSSLSAVNHQRPGRTWWPVPDYTTEWIATSEPHYYDTLNEAYEDWNF
jgi:hypothetical protein